MTRNARRIPLIAAGAALLAAGALAVGSLPASAQSGGGCQLNGNANFSPGLGSSSQSFSYNFAGSLTSCQSTTSAPASGTVGAGNVVPETVTVSTAGGPVTATFNYQEPVPTGSGGCASSTTSGDSFVTWADGTQTALSYSTSGVLAAVDLSGTVVPSVVLQPVAGQGITSGGVFYPAPSYTFTTTRFAGDTANGTLTFQPADPTACNTSAGVTTAAISGGVFLNG